MNSLEGKTALVTGAGHGLGKAGAIAYAKRGARVFVNDIDQTTGEATVAEIQSAGGKANFIKADVSSAPQIERMIEEIVAASGRLDIAFNNAGIAPSTSLLPTTPMTNGIRSFGWTSIPCFIARVPRSGPCWSRAAV